MMSEYTTLTSYLEALVAKKEELNNVDVEAVVDGRLAEMRAKVKAEVMADIATQTLVTEAQITAVTNSITIVSYANEVAEETAEVDEDEVSEVISE